MTSTPVRLAVLLSLAAAVACGPARPAAVPAGPSADALRAIDTVVVIFAENRSFDNLFGAFPGADGIADASAASRRQVDRDGRALRELPPIWGGLTARGVTPPVTQAETEHLPNAPFAVDDPNGFGLSQGTVTRDLVHRFYQNQMQIDGGRNDGFAAWGDSGALVMSHWDGSRTALWDVASEYVLADHFFMSGFGGSFYNHIRLICACTPFYPDADTNPARPSIAAVERDGVSLALADNSPASALDGPPKFVQDGNLTPDFYAVNTMQPPYQPSGNPPAAGGDPRFADPSLPTTLPPQTETTIGDLLSAKGISWAWYGGAWQYALDHGADGLVPNFQFHHQPFNYFRNFAPATDARAEHLLDGGVDGVAFLRDVDDGRLPQVAFYKPQGNLNQHSGYADVASGDRHLADVVRHLERSPQWPHMLVILTYDENGGIWDHVAPPKGDRWGPGSRIPAIIVSPFARRHYVDKTPYDTDSILRFLTRRFELPTLDGLRERDAAMRRAGEASLGDLTAALELP